MVVVANNVDLVSQCLQWLLELGLVRSLKTTTQNSTSRPNERNWNDWSVFMHVNKSICAGRSPTGDERDLKGIAISTDQVVKNVEEF